MVHIYGAGSIICHRFIFKIIAVFFVLATSFTRQKAEKDNGHQDASLIKGKTSEKIQNSKIYLWKWSGTCKSRCLNVIYAF
jgi:hypothetical protein